MLDKQKLELLEKAIERSLKQGGKDGHCALVQVMPHDLMDLIRDARELAALSAIVEAAPPSAEQLEAHNPEFIVEFLSVDASGISRTRRSVAEQEDWAGTHGWRLTL